MPESERDSRIRLAAFARVKELSRMRTSIQWSQIAEGFEFEGETILLANRARGIFKPRQMDSLLSIKTVIPKPGRALWYDDQHSVGQAVTEDRQHFEYSFMRGGPAAPANVLLRNACEERIPIIYFLAVAPGIYCPIVPAFLYDWDPVKNQCLVGPGNASRASEPVIEPRPIEDADERRFYMHQTLQRAHQARFRRAVMDAYGERCAISGLPVPDLLDAAHIIEPRDLDLGQPVVQNGLPLSKIHHAAFDNHLIGVDPDYCVHVSERLLDEHDGPVLEALKNVRGTPLILPDRPLDYPDPDRLARRFERFRAAA